MTEIKVHVQANTRKLNSVAVDLIQVVENVSSTTPI